MAERDRDVLRFHVKIEAVVAAVAPEAARLHSAERGRKMPDIFGIYPYHSGLERLRDAVCAARVLGPDVAG